MNTNPNPSKASLVLTHNRHQTSNIGIADMQLRARNMQLAIWQSEVYYQTQVWIVVG